MSRRTLRRAFLLALAIVVASWFLAPEPIAGDDLREEAHRQRD